MGGFIGGSKPSVPTYVPPPPPTPIAPAPTPAPIQDKALEPTDASNPLQRRRGSSDSGSVTLLNQASGSSGSGKTLLGQ